MNLSTKNACIVWLAALLITVSRSNAGTDESGPMMKPSQPRAGISGTLRDRPFHAKFEITGVQPSPDDGPWVNEMFRNRAGSVRTEISGHQFGWIIDASKQRLIVLDYAAKVALVSNVKVPETSDSSPRWAFNQFPTITEESTSILGVSCKKVIL